MFCLWGISSVIDIEVGKAARCGWRRSLGWAPGLMVERELSPRAHALTTFWLWMQCGHHLEPPQLHFPSVMSLQTSPAHPFSLEWPLLKFLSQKTPGLKNMHLVNEWKQTDTSLWHFRTPRIDRKLLKLLKSKGPESGWLWGSSEARRQNIPRMGPEEAQCLIELVALAGTQVQFSETTSGSSPGTASPGGSPPSSDLFWNWHTQRHTHTYT